MAARVADGEDVDWAAEVDRWPELERAIGNLRWLEATRVARRLAGSTSAQVADQTSLASHQPSAQAKVSPIPGYEPIELEAGSKWGKLEILGKLGHGSGGEVFRAHDPESGCEVALKVWRENEFYQTTGTEARQILRVEHEAIINVLGSDRHEGLAGMWMELVHGRNLDEVLEQDGAFEEAVARHVGVVLGDALGAMHAKGIVHRDLKAHNVMLDEGGRVILLDFGSAKSLPRGEPEPTKRLRGTPLTTAPEVLCGSKVGPSADIYSLGVLLYRLVTGGYPVEAETIPELIDRHRAGKRTKLSDRREDLSEGFVAAIERALEPNPLNRHVSMQAFALVLGGTNLPSRHWLLRVLGRLGRGWV